MNISIIIRNVCVVQRMPVYFYTLNVQNSYTLGMLRKLIMTLNITGMRSSIKYVTLEGRG